MNATHAAPFSAVSIDWTNALAPLSAPQPTSWLARLRQFFLDEAYLAAQSRAESPLWDIGQSDPRVMAELMLARKCDDRVASAPARAMSAIADAETVPTVVPKVSSLLGQGWASVIEDAYQARTRNALWRYA